MFSFLAVLVAILFWLADSGLHFYVYGEEVLEFIPSNGNELWMRSAIVGMIVLSGIFGDFHVRKMMEKQKKIEALNIYESTCFAADQILKNLLEQLELVKTEALRTPDFDREVIEFYDAAVRDASTLLENLSNVKEISGENIKKAVHY